MLEESGIHITHIFGGTRKGMHNTQTRSQKELNFIVIYIAYIAKKWDQNKNENENSLHGA